MTTVEKITQHVQVLPEPVQQEVLDFVEFLKSRRQIPKDRDEDAVWTELSLTSAMRGMVVMKHLMAVTKSQNRIHLQIANDRMLYID